MKISGDYVEIPHRYIKAKRIDSGGMEAMEVFIGILVVSWRLQNDYARSDSQTIASQMFSFLLVGRIAFI
jgi:hypothetical protein